ncbi:MAG: hypothetical protein GMKNLPBB_01908 [Myxococcota bacterium]|nr:hypothetical protein [Myxococcota bacterium]
MIQRTANISALALVAGALFFSSCKSDPPPAPPAPAAAPRQIPPTQPSQNPPAAARGSPFAALEYKAGSLIGAASVPNADGAIKTRASGVGGDCSAAKKAALINAITTALGVALSKTSTVFNGALMNSDITSETRGVIKAYEVESEKPMGSLCEVAVTAFVQPEQLDRALYSLMRNDAIVVVTSETDIQGAQVHYLADHITKSLLDARFQQVTNYLTFQKEGTEELAKALSQNNHQAAAKIGVAYLAGAVAWVRMKVHQGQQNPGFFTARAEGEAVLFRPSEGRIVASIPAMEVIGSSPKDFDTAGREAARELARKVSDKFLQAVLAAHGAVPFRDMTLEVSGTRDARACAAVEEFLKSMEQVREVRLDSLGCHRIKSVFLFRHRLSTSDLMARVSQIIKVSEFNDDLIRGKYVE